MNTIDLHIHSKYSLDGEKEVQELIDMAVKNNVEMIAIADHNTTLAYRDTIDQKGISIIPAIEVDCTFQDRDFHILGYGVDPYAEVWDALHESVTQMEKESGLKRLAFIRDRMGIQVDQKRLEELRPNGVYEAETVCEVALSMPENDENPYLAEFRPGKKHGTSPYVDFFWEYCAKGKMAYYPMEFITMEEIISIFRDQGALVVLAHPGNNVKEDAELMNGILDLHIDGLEVYSSYHSKEQIGFYRDVAERNRLLMTCGSDFHGKTKPRIVMGNCQMPQDKEAALKKVMNEIKK